MQKHEPLMTSQPADRSRLIEHLRKRQHDCEVEKQAYAIWLGLLTPVRWFTIIGGIVLSAVAGGAVLLAEYRVIGDGWRIYGAACAIVASVLTGIHTALNCDAHQTSAEDWCSCTPGSNLPSRQRRFLSTNNFDSDSTSSRQNLRKLEVKPRPHCHNGAAGAPSFINRRH